MPSLPPTNTSSTHAPLNPTLAPSNPPSTVQAAKKSRTGVKNYKDEEVTTLLNLIETMKPLSETKRQEVANL